MDYSSRGIPPDFGLSGEEALFSTVFQNPGMERPLNSAQLTSGLAYQRPVNQREVDELANDWQPDLFEPPIVSYRDGKFFLVDGQRRIAALRQRNRGGDVTVLCRVFENLTYEEEADLLVRIDRAKKNMTLSESTNARRESRKDPTTEIIFQILRRAGFTWTLQRRETGNYKINATSAVFHAYNLLGKTDFARMMDLLRGTWEGSPASVTATMLAGMSLFVKTYDLELDDQNFVRRLSAVSAVKVLALAKEEDSKGSRNLRCARVLWQLYNKGCRMERQLPRRGKI